jgi:hypothetical protein
MNERVRRKSDPLFVWRCEVPAKKKERKNLTISLLVADYALLQQLSDETGKSRQQIVREGIRAIGRIWYGQMPNFKVVSIVGVEEVMGDD